MYFKTDPYSQNKKLVNIINMTDNEEKLEKIDDEINEKLIATKMVSNLYGGLTTIY